MCECHYDDWGSGGFACVLLTTYAPLHLLAEWSTIDLVYLKTVYGFAVEVPIAYLTVRTALEQCHDHATHTAMARAKRESRDRMDGRRSRSPQMTSV